MGTHINGRVAVFGGTGLLGHELITDLVTAWPTATFEIYARSSASASGKVRAHQASLRALGQHDHGARLNFHRADLSRPDLDLDAEGREALLGCDHIVNAAADVSFGLPLAVARNRNVDTLAHLLETVAASRPFVHQVSTAYVGHGEGMVEPVAPVGSTMFRNTYEQSKAEAEILLASADLPWRIYRPSIIVGSSRDGRAQSYDTVYVFARALLSGQMAAVPVERTQRLDIVPSDYVARSIRRLVEVGEPCRAYHITAGESFSPQASDLVDSFHRVLTSVGHPAAEWSHPHVLRMLPPTWFDGLLRLPSNVAPRRLRAAAETARIFLPFVRDDVPIFDPSETVQLIRECPPAFHEYADRMWRSALADGFGGTIRTNSPSRPTPSGATSLADVVQRAAEQWPDAVAAESEEVRLTFGELQATATKVASQLRDLGIESGVRIGLVLQQRVADLALLLAATVTDARVQLLPDEAAAKVNDFAFVLTITDDFTIELKAVGEVYLDDPGIVLETSGTTGPPKLVHHSHASLAHCGAATARRLSVDSTQKVALFLPLHHAYATCVVVPGAWSRGAAVTLLPDPAGALLDQISDSGATHVVGVMEHFQRLSDEMEARCEGPLPDLSAWEVALCGDDPVLPTVWERFEQAFRRPLAQGYGLTECLLVAVGTSPRGAHEGMVVRPLPDVRIEILDVDGAALGEGEVGEIWVDAPWRMTGPAAGAPLPPGTVPSGDDGFMDEEGNLHIIGRRLNGTNVTEGASSACPEGRITTEIEDVLIQDARISRVHVLWREHEALAFVEPENGVDNLPESISILGVDVRLVCIDRLPRTPVGKVSRRRLAIECPAGDRG